MKVNREKQKNKQNLKKKKRQTHVPIEKIILSVIGVAGIIAVVAIAPGIGPAFKLFGIPGNRSYSKQYVHRALTRMQQKGLIVFEEKNGKRYARLTQKGEEKRTSIEMQLKAQTPKKWDGRWRIVIFDISEHRRSVRDKVRSEMQNVGFVKLQQSVWVCPYECEEYVTLLKADVRIGNAVRYMRVDWIENDTALRKHFDLKRK